MQSDDIYRAISAILVAQFKASPQQISPTAQLDDLLQDSLDIAEFGVVLSEHFNISIDDDEIAEARELHQVTSLVTLRTAAGP